MACMCVGSVSTAMVGQNDAVRSDLPSIQYDSNGAFKKVLSDLVANNSDLKQRSQARITALENTVRSMSVRSDTASAWCFFDVVGAIAISIFFPPTALIALPTGAIKGIVDGYNASCSDTKRYWLQVELDAEQAFNTQHPDKLGDENARGEFVYNYIFNQDPGTTLKENPVHGGYEGWSANRHVFAEAQGKYDALARLKPVPERTYIDYD